MLLIWGSGARDQQLVQGIGIGLIWTAAAILSPPPVLNICDTAVVSLTPSRTVDALTPCRSVVSLIPERTVRHLCP